MAIGRQVERCVRGHDLSLAGRSPRSRTCRICDRENKARARIAQREGLSPQRIPAGTGYVLDGAGLRWTEQTLVTRGRLRALASHMIRHLPKDEYSEHHALAREALAFISETAAKDGTGLEEWREAKWDRAYRDRDLAVDDLLEANPTDPEWMAYLAHPKPIDPDDEANWPELDRRADQRLAIARKLTGPADLVEALRLVDFDDEEDEEDVDEAAHSEAMPEDVKEEETV